MPITDNSQVIPPARQDCRTCGDQTGLPRRVYREPTRKLPIADAWLWAYLMKNVLHDWDDCQACEIPVNCRRVVPADGALLLVEWGLSDANLPSTGKLTDLVMLVQTGGKERTTCRGLPAQGGPAR